MYNLNCPPLLESIYDQIPWGNMENTYIIASQHLLADTHMIFRKLFEQGFPLENLSINGKCYSASRDVVAEMMAEGIDVDLSCLSFISDEEFDNYYDQNIADFLHKTLKKIKGRNIDKLIILDDGGHLLAEVNKHVNELPPVVGIEQTSAGYHLLKKEPLNFPVVNIARSFPKLNVEATMIAKGIWSRVNAYCEETGKNPHKILIIGNGAIGKHLKYELQNDYEVSIYDVNQEISDVVNLEESLGDFDVIIGCTGGTSIPHSIHHKIKPGTILASGSSSDREFDAVHFRKRAQNVINQHENLVIEGVHLLNCGFPVNFYGERFSSIPLSEIQLTLSLLSSALFQASQTPSFIKDFIELDPTLEKNIMEGFYFLQNEDNTVANSL